MPLPLDGDHRRRVEQAVAAPFATRQLADLGARVIKIERPTAATSRAATTRPSTGCRATSSG
jgi:crotonobetainyl-CoA:carnitine CoA-transferase CaiB-like acyl-CoA transferase